MYVLICGMALLRPDVSADHLLDTGETQAGYNPYIRKPHEMQKFCHLKYSAHIGLCDLTCDICFHCVQVAE